MTAPRFTFSVHGTPAGQGNLKGSKHGKFRHAAIALSGGADARDR